MSAEYDPIRMTKKKILVEKVYQIKRILREMGIHTICESAKCPNIGECFSKPTLTYILLGNVCSRNCDFCSVEKGKPKAIDFEEPQNIAKATQRMELKHTILTSVCRDDLADGGALHFAHTIYEVTKLNPHSTIEVLVPDFNASRKALNTILDAKPHIFNHNIKTVPRLYSKVNSKANYEKSLKVLKTIKRLNSQIITKSGFMVGMGESEDEVIMVMKDLMNAKCDILTIGQYLQPTRDNMPVDTFLAPEAFLKLRDHGLNMGFRHVESAPFVRSSYNSTLYLIGDSKKNAPRKRKNGKISTYQETATIRI